MQIIQSLMYFVTHVNVVLADWVSMYGGLAYFLMFLVVFAETGLVVTPFLPGDTLLFAAGVISAVPASAGQTGLNVWLCMIVFGLGAFVGDNVNYWFGYFLGPRVMRNEKSRIFRKSYLDRTHQFFEQYGPTAVVAARFVPVVRTFAPFTAGVGRMPYGRFISFSLAGTVLWVGTFTMLGHFFGNIPWVQDHFELTILALVVISGLPIVVESLRRRAKARRAAAAEVASPDGPAEGDAGV